MIPFLSLAIAGVWVERNYCTMTDWVGAESFGGSSPAALVGSVSGTGCNRWHFHARGDLGGQGRWSDRLRLTWTVQANAPVSADLSVGGARGGGDIVLVGSLLQSGSILSPHFTSGSANGTWSTEIIVSSQTDVTVNVTASVVLCRADWDGDGMWAPADIAVFVNDWLGALSGGGLSADFDGNGLIEPGDIAGFVSAWLAQR